MIDSATAIRLVAESIQFIPFQSHTTDKTVSSYYAEERIYIVRKQTPTDCIYMIVGAKSTICAEEKMINTLKSLRESYK